MDKPDLVQTLEHYGADLTRCRETGWSKLRCPFHGHDRTPSASVNIEAGKFKCFSCDVTGDSIDLIMQAEGTDFGGALAFARDKLGFAGTRLREAAPARYRPSWAQDDD